MLMKTTIERPHKSWCKHIIDKNYLRFKGGCNTSHSQQYIDQMLNRNHRGRQRQQQQMGDFPGHVPGPNWVLIAGGALVTVVSFVIGQRESLPKGRELEKRKDKNYSKSKAASGNSKLGCHQAAESEDCGHQSNSHVDGTSSPRTSYFQMQSHRTKSHCEQEVHSTPEPVKSYMTPPCTNEDRPCSSPAPVALQTVVLAKCNMVRQLRQQLKRRDGMIFDMQEQIIDQDLAVASHQEHIANLKVQLEESSNLLFASKQEVQHLERALADLSAKLDASSKDCSGFDYGKILKSLNMEVGRLTGEVTHLKVENRELLEKVTCLEREKRERSLLVQEAMSLEHEKLVQKVLKLETELQEGRKSLLERDRLFEVNEQHQSEKTNSLHHNHKQTQKKKMEKVVHSQASKLLDPHNSNYEGQWIGNDEPHNGTNSHAKALPRHMGMANSSHSCTGSAVHTLSTAFLRSDDSNHNVANFKAGSNGRCQVKARGLSNGRDKTMTKITALDPATDEIMGRSAQQEVLQFATDLATPSNMTSDSIDDDVKEHINTMTPIRLNSDDEPNWAELSQHLSFSTGATSPAQVKELSQKLEQVAKQRQMGEEIAELKKHQAKIAELKQRVGKLTTKCQLWYAQTREDKVHVQHTLRVAALILELADRLTAQEEQARQTSTEVQQQISASFQPLPTNITKSKKEDIQKGDDSTKITPHTNGDGNYTPPPRYTAHDKMPRENCGILFSPPISFTFAEEVARPNINDQEQDLIASQLTEDTHDVTLAIPSPPASKIQDLFLDRAVKKTTSRKQPVSHENGRECLAPDSSSGSKKNSSPLEHVQSKASDILMAQEGSQKYSNSQSNSHRGDKSHNLASDQQMGGHQRQSMEEEVSLLALEIEQVMAETSAVPLLSSLSQNPRFSSLVNSLAISVESPMVPTDSKSLTTFSFDHMHYIDDGEFLVDPLHSRSDRSTEDQDDEKGETEDDTSSGNYTWNPGHRIQAYSESVTLSPFSKMVACLDLKQLSSTTSLQESEIYWKDTMFPANMSVGEALDSNKACKLSTHTRTGGKEIGGSESMGSSIDSAFNEILDHTLEDLVKICSTATTPSGTPSSSTFSQGSVSKLVQQQF